MGYLTHEFRLKDIQTGKAIADSGGKAVVMTAGSPDKATLYDPDNDFAALANPITPTRGLYRFAVADTVLSVDIAVQAPGGQFLFLSGVVAQDRTEYAIDLGRKQQVYKLPFSYVDQAGDATETDTGFDLPVCLLSPWGMVQVTAADASITIDVGLLSSESGGDADGIMDGIATDNAVIVKPTLLASGDTMGALMSVLDSANAGDDAPESHVVTGAAAKSITYTLLTGANTAKGYIHLPILLA